MAAGLGRALSLAGGGVVGGLALVAAIFGTGDLLKHARSVVAPEAPRTAADLPDSGKQAGGKPADEPAETGRQAAVDPGGRPDRAPKTQARPREEPGAKSETRPAAETAPSLDIVRVEPSGEAVLAGRGAPKAAIEVLRDNQPIARVTADESGQFAVVPPAPLPTGNSEITLRAVTPDGKATPGRESVVVVIAKERDAKPLVAVSEPDKPTRVLSQPEEPKQAAAGPKPAKPEAKAPQREAALPNAAKPGAKPGTKPDAPGASEAPVKIVSVDAQDGGRLFVSGQATAWTSLRLYLNDTLVASGRSGADGRIGFTIGRGVKPGGYQIRIDQVESESGKVRNRAQVAFTFPTQFAAKEPAKQAGREPGKQGAPPELQVPDKPAAGAKPVAELPAPKPPAKPSSEIGTAPEKPAKEPAKEPAREKMAEKPAPEKPAPTASSPGPRPKAETMVADKPAPATPEPGKRRAAAPAQSAAPAEPVDQPGSVFVPEISTAKITRGDNLWFISRRTYGDGRRYTVIYDANQEQIRDPDLIYPGQIFVLPKDEPAADKPGAKRG